MVTVPFPGEGLLLEENDRIAVVGGRGKSPPVAPSHPSCRSVRVSLVIEAKKRRVEMEISLQNRFRCSPLAYVCDAVGTYDLNGIVFPYGSHH